MGVRRSYGGLCKPAKIKVTQIKAAKVAFHATTPFPVYGGRTLAKVCKVIHGSSHNRIA